MCHRRFLRSRLWNVLQATEPYLIIEKSFKRAQVCVLFPSVSFIIILIQMRVILKDQPANAPWSTLDSDLCLKYKDFKMLGAIMDTALAVLIRHSEATAERSEPTGFDDVFLARRLLTPCIALNSALSLTMGQHDWPKHRSSLKHSPSHASFCVTL